MKKLGWFALLISQMTFANPPVFQITPLIVPPPAAHTGQILNASYMVTNTTPYTLVNNGLRYAPEGQTPQGVTQVPGTGSICSDPFTLGPGQSCTLNLTFTASGPGFAATTGPEVCNLKSHPAHCSVPAAGSQLNVSGGAISAYISDFVDHNIRQCIINTSSGPTQGTFTSCVDAGAQGIGSELVWSIVFQTFNNQNYVYYPVPYTGVFRCLVGSDGNFTGCASVSISPTVAGTFYGLAFYETQGQLYAYLSDGQQNDPIYSCTPSADGSSFTNCVDSGSGTFSEGAVSIVFQSFGGTPYTYVSNANTGIPGSSNTQLTVGSGGELSFFNDVLTDGAATYFAFTNLSGTNYMYLVDNGAMEVDQCTLSGTNGSELDVCTALTPPVSFNTPLGIAITTLNGTQYGYISDVFGRNVYVCTLAQAPTGFSSCVNAGGSFFNPAAITLW